MKLPKELQKKKKRKYKYLEKAQANRKISKEDYEIIQKGPFVFERYGRIIHMSSILRPKEHKQYLKELKSKRPDVKNNIENLIEKVKDIAQNYNIVDLLQFVCLKNTFTNPKIYKESTYEGKEAIVEYALNLISSLNSISFDNHPNMEILNQFNDKISEILDLTIYYYMLENLGDKNDILKKQIRFRSILKFLTLRGDSYQQHHIELIKKVFISHNQMLEKSIGYKIEDIIEFIQKIRDEVQRNKDYQINQRTKISTNFEKNLNDFLKTKGFSSKDNLTYDVLREFSNLEVNRKLNKEIKKFLSEIEKSIFRVLPSENLPEKIFSLFSIEVGENDLFIQPTPFWPLNNSKIYLKPILKINEEFYVFGGGILFRNIISILEYVIKNYDEQYFREKYLKTKAKLLEEESFRYFKKILPKAKQYRNLYYYHFADDGNKKRFETDGLILYDNYLFIIEAKAHKFSISARRGSLIRIEKTTKEIIDVAYSQALRCKDYILNNEKSEFKYENGKKALVIIRDNIKSILLINTTFENLGFLSTELYNVKRLKLIEGKEYPWSVYINDLKIIAEINDLSSVFLLFLQRRVDINKLNIIMTNDEIDYYMFFLKEGLYFDKKNWAKREKIHLFGYTDELDKFYLYKEGLISQAEKPRLNIDKEYENLVLKIEATNKEGFTTITTTLLSLSSIDQQKILEIIKKLRNDSKIFSKDLKAFLYYKKEKLGIFFVIRTNVSKKTWTQFEKFVELMMYKYKLNSSIMIMITYTNGSEILDFKIFEKPWKFDYKMDKLSKKFKFNGMKYIKGSLANIKGKHNLKLK